MGKYDEVASVVESLERLALAHEHQLKVQKQQLECDTETNKILKELLTIHQNWKAKGVNLKRTHRT